MGVIVPDKATAKALNNKARHEMIERLLYDILFDLQVCELEGWDKREFIEMLYDEMRGLMDAFDNSGS